MLYMPIEHSQTIARSVDEIVIKPYCRPVINNIIIYMDANEALSK